MIKRTAMLRAPPHITSPSSSVVAAAAAAASSTNTCGANQTSSIHQQHRNRLLYVAVALSEIDHVAFHRLKFHQLCKVTRAEAPRPFPLDKRVLRAEGRYHDGTDEDIRIVEAQTTTVADALNDAEKQQLLLQRESAEVTLDDEASGGADSDAKKDDKKTAVARSLLRPLGEEATADEPAVAAAENAESDYVDFRMLAFSKEGTFVTQWLSDDALAAFHQASPLTIPTVEKVPFEAPIIVEKVVVNSNNNNATTATISNNSNMNHSNSSGDLSSSPHAIHADDGGLENSSSDSGEQSDEAAAPSTGIRSASSSSSAETETVGGSGNNSSGGTPPSSLTDHQQPQDYIRVDNTIIKGRRDSANRRTLCLVRVSDVCAFDLERMRHFLEQNMATTTDTAATKTNAADTTDESSSAHAAAVENQLIFGAHGYGFALGVNVRVVRGEDDSQYSVAMSEAEAMAKSLSGGKQSFEEEDKKKTCCSNGGTPTAETEGGGGGGQLQKTLSTAVATVDRCVEKDGYYVSISLVDLVRTLDGLRFKSICFDCCLMSTAQTAAAMYKVTPHVVACEGYMWEEDNDIERHVLNSYSARYLAFGVEGDEELFAGHHLTHAHQQLQNASDDDDDDDDDDRHPHEFDDNDNDDRQQPSPHHSVAPQSFAPIMMGASPPMVSTAAIGDEVGSAKHSRSDFDDLIALEVNHSRNTCADDGSSDSRHRSPAAVPPTPVSPTPITADETAPTTALTRALVDDNKRHHTVPQLIAIARHFASHSSRGDIAVLNTEAGTLLYHHLLLSKAQIVPFLHRPASLTTARPLGLDVVGPRVHQCSPLDSRDPEVGSFLYDIKAVIDTIDGQIGGPDGGGGGSSSSHQSTPSSPDALLTANTSALNNGNLLLNKRRSNGGISISSSLSRQWVDKANELLSATVLFNIPPAEDDAKYYTCPAPLRGLSVKI